MDMGCCNSEFHALCVTRYIYIYALRLCLGLIISCTGGLLRYCIDVSKIC